MDRVRRSSTLQPIGIASGKAPGSSSDGIVTRPWWQWQSIIAIIEIIGLSGGFELIAD